MKIQSSAFLVVVTGISALLLTIPPASAGGPDGCCDQFGSCFPGSCGACAGACFPGEGSCAGVVCPQPGACCDTIGCTDELETECSGEFLGEGTTCFTGDPTPCCFDFNEPGCASDDECCDFFDGAQCESGTCCFPLGGLPQVDGCFLDSECCAGTCHEFDFGDSACCFELGTMGCSLNADCCSFFDGGACNDGTCCLPASGTPPPGAEPCVDDSDCCAGTCNPAPPPAFGNICCFESGESGCTSDFECCDVLGGASCEAGVCCLPARGAPSSFDAECVDDGDCCIGTCKTFSTPPVVGDFCCVESGESGCTNDFDCCDVLSGATCEAGVCCLPARGVPGPFDAECVDDGDCCKGTCNSLSAPTAGDFCCVESGESGCANEFECCDFFFSGATCEAGVCCLPPNGVPQPSTAECSDDADCCRGTCNTLSTGDFCCIASGEIGCFNEFDCCDFFFSGAACQAGVCCLPPNGAPQPSAAECSDDADCCRGTCNTLSAGDFCCIASGETGCINEFDCCDVLSGAICEAGVCGVFGACTTCCECTRLRQEECAAIGGEFHQGFLCADLDFEPDTTPPQIICPDAITVANGSRVCGGIQTLLGSLTVSDDCGEPTVSTDAPECGLPFGSTTTVTFTAEDECENTASCTADITIGPAPRVDISKKGSLLAFSKIDLRWNAAGALVQDTFISLINDFPGDVNVQMYFVNGDAALDPLFSNTQPPVLLAEGEPGWNWVDCQVLLTPDQPVYWSAATGSPLGCQPFSILDPNLGNGHGRPNPEAADGSRVLRGFVIAFAVNESGAEIKWDHLSGKGTIVNYADASAWEYAPFAFQAPCGTHGEQPLDCTEFDEQGVCCSAEVIPGSLGADGVQYDYAFDALLLDFLGVGSQALSAVGSPTTVDTDLTLHILSADLRQETEGPVTTKAHFDIWNMNERKLSNTRRCLTCWDQTLLSRYGAPNSFLLANLQSDKGKARIDGLQANECEENCLRDEQGEPLDIEELLELLGDLFDPVDSTCSQDAALLGLVAKHLTFGGPAGQRAVAGSELMGMGTQRAHIRYDVVGPPGTLREDAYNRLRADSAKPALPAGRLQQSRAKD